MLIVREGVFFNQIKTKTKGRYYLTGITLTVSHFIYHLGIGLQLIWTKSKLIVSERVAIDGEYHEISYDWSGLNNGSKIIP